MSEKTVIVEKKGSIATIILNRSNALNALNDVLADDFLEALLEVEKDPEVRVVVLTGKGRAFCAGGDLFHLVQIKNSVEAKRFIQLAGKLIKLIMGMDKPFIAMVNGVAAGAGFNFALACDIIFGAKSAKFIQSFANVALVPDCGGNYLLPKAVGLHKAKEFMFTADAIDSATALDLKIVNYVVEDSELEEKTYKFAERLAKSAPFAIASMKKMINRSFEVSLETMLELEEDLQSLCLNTEDHKEGVAAFKDKRPPAFKGR